MATLRRSNNTIIASNLTPYATHKMVHAGDAVPTTPGNQDWLDVKLVSAGKDTLYIAASSGNPVLLGIDHITWTPRRYPES